MTQNTYLSTEQLKRMVNILKNARRRVEREKGPICLKIGDITKASKKKGDPYLGDYLCSWIADMLRPHGVFLEAWLESKHARYPDRSNNREQCAPLRIRWLTWMIEQLEKEIAKKDKEERVLALRLAA